MIPNNLADSVWAFLFDPVELAMPCLVCKLLRTWPWYLPTSAGLVEHANLRNLIQMRYSPFFYGEFLLFAL